MCEVTITEISDDEPSPRPERRAIMPKIEVLKHELPSENVPLIPVGVNVASSSSKLRSSYIGMGFKPAHVDKAIEEVGEDDPDLLLETLFAYSAAQELDSTSEGSFDGLFSNKKNEFAAENHAREALHKSESSDSLDSLFNDEKATNDHAICGRDSIVKEEPELQVNLMDDKKQILLAMSFHLDEVFFATDKLGKDAPIDELVDFIFAARMAGKYEKDQATDNKERNKECSTDALFGTMDLTLELLKMGFSEREISTAFEMHGSGASLSKLADSIIVNQRATVGIKVEESSSASFDLEDSCSHHTLRSLDRRVEDGSHYQSFNPLAPKSEEISAYAISGSKDFDMLEKFKGKRPKEEVDIDGSGIFKRPKLEYNEILSSSSNQPRPVASNGNLSLTGMLVRRKQSRENGFEMTNTSTPISCRSINEVAAEPPYFFYGNVMNLSDDSWSKISHFLYSRKPEFVNTQLFSALSRKEGYVHNLSSATRFHVIPKPAMTIKEALPHTAKWWPSWDTRNQLSCINSETTGISHVCDELGRKVKSSNGLLSTGQQRSFLQQCDTLNLVWVNKDKLAPMDPEHVESILGYSVHHTRAAAFSLTERLQSLKYSFQIHTLAYHLSPLKSLFPGGLRVLSIFSGIGGAEIALHRLGIHLKVVVSVEPCEIKRRILKQWWGNTVQTGELIQIEDVHNFGKLQGLIKKFGGFDLVIGQNPCPQPAKYRGMAADGDSFEGLDFTTFCEFARVLQCVKYAMRNR